MNRIFPLTIHSLPSMRVKGNGGEGSGYSFQFSVFSFQFSVFGVWRFGWAREWGAREWEFDYGSSSLSPTTFRSPLNSLPSPLCAAGLQARNGYAAVRPLRAITLPFSSQLSPVSFPLSFLLTPVYCLLSPVSSLRSCPVADLLGQGRQPRNGVSGIRGQRRTARRIVARHGRLLQQL